MYLCIPRQQNNVETSSEPPEPVQDFENLSLSGQANPQRISKAQKRRIKKVTQLKERELRILEQEIVNLNGARHLETEEIKRILKEKELMISEIPSDGNWLVLPRFKKDERGSFVS